MSSLKVCCQPHNTTSSVTGDRTDCAFECGIQETGNNVNNNNIFDIMRVKNRKYSFPIKQAIDLRFDNITFEAIEWSFRNLQKGEYSK